MKSMKRFVSLCLMLCMLLSLLPVGVFAEAHTLPESMRFTYTNPLYADTVTEWDLVQPGQPLLYGDNTVDGKYYDAETAGKMIRDDLVARDTTISVNVSFPYNADTIEQDMQALVLDIMASAMEHTGNPVEGDYLLWQYTGFEVGFDNFSLSGQNVGATATFTMTYHADAAQEAAVDSAVAQLLSQLNVSGKDSYTKIKAIYDYITANITYDYDNLQNNSYKLKHTAYAALINKTAVCQGYAVLLYRLALELGVDCRMIPGNSDGQGHVWNIAKLDGKYYNLDSTWDAGLPIYQCFLVGSDNFDNHDRWDTPGQMPSKDNYNSAAFHAAYPMSKTDYVGGCNHNYTAAVVAPTCTEKGYTTYTCNICGDSYNGDEVAALGHNEVTDKGYAATCTEEGLTDGKHCDRCNTVLTKQEVIPALGHSWDAGKVTKEPTEEETGIRTYTCTACGATKTEEIPKLDHTHAYQKVVTAPTCTEKGYTTYTCACGDTYTADEVAALGHNEVTDKGYAATCTEEGLSDGKHCDRCNTVLTKQEVIPALGHSWDAGKVTKEPTEEEAGVRTYTCTACGATKTEEIPKLDHTHTYQKAVTAPTCTEKGYTTYTCACGDTYTADEVAALGHNEVTDKGYAATCTEEGLTDGKHCDRCNTVLTKQETIPALGHSWDDGEITKEPTEEETGICTYTCGTCGETRTETIPTLDHQHIYRTVITEPTCTEEGYTTYTCTCGDTYTADEVAALGHNEVTDKGYGPTCTEEGLTDGVHCGRCGEVLTKQEVIPAMGHDFADGVCGGCGAEAVAITTQPKTAYAKMGETAKATVKAEGDGLTYQWYIRNADKTKYAKSSVTGPTYSCRMSEKSKNRRALCIITDAYGNEVQTKTIVIREAASIITEPKTTYAKSGATAKVKIEASGDGLKYQWYIKNAGKDKYSKSTVKTDTYTVKMSDKVNGRRIRCIVTDKYGNKVETKTVVLRMAATIVTQPKDVTAPKGETVKVTLKAVGTELTYQWYIKNAGKDKFVKSSVTSATYTVKMAKKADGRKVYCVVKDNYGKSVKSDIVTLSMS